MVATDSPCGANCSAWSRDRHGLCCTSPCFKRFGGASARLDPWRNCGYDVRVGTHLRRERISSVRTQTYKSNRRRGATAGRIARRENTTFQCLGDRSHGTSSERRPDHRGVPAPFSGTLTGSYSNVHIPFAGNILSYSTSGTLTGVGSTRLYGSLFARGKARSGRPLGELVMHNTGGSMLVKVFQSATPGTDTYRVARASGNDTSYKGETGVLMITQNPTFRTPYYVSGQATMTFTPG